MSLTIPYTNEEFLALLEKANKGSTGIGKNLLDNWYFGNPVDQREGWIVPKGTGVYSDTACTKFFGNAQNAYPVVAKTDTYGQISVAAGTKYVPISDCVRGYTGTGHGIDRYWSAGTDVVILVEDDGISFSGNDWGEKIENSRIPLNTDLTYSFLTADNKLNYTTFQFDGTTQQFVTVYFDDTGVRTNFIYNWAIDGNTPFFLQAGNVKIAAHKLEIGSKQTLAHQDEDGKWVLNEIPNYAEELAKCQRYFVRLKNIAGGTTATIGFLSAWGSDGGNLFVPMPTTMRTTPVASYYGNFRLRGNGKSIDISEFSRFDAAHPSNNGITLNVGVANSPLASGYVYAFMFNGNAASYVDLDANL